MDEIKLYANTLLKLLEEDNSLSTTQRGTVRELQALLITTFQADIMGAFVHVVYALRERIRGSDVTYFSSSGFIDSIRNVVFKYCQKHDFKDWKTASDYLTVLLSTFQLKAKQSGENAGFSSIMKQLNSILDQIDSINSKGK
jgi:hypothetical protein